MMPGSNPQLPYATETLRAIVQRVDGREVRLKSIFDADPFTAEVTADQALELSGYLLREVDLEVTMARDAGGRIVSCRIDAMTAVSDEDPTAAWREWFRPHAEYWDKVDDISSALGRRS